MANEGTNRQPELVLQPFNAKAERNDYEVRPIIFITRNVAYPYNNTDPLGVA
jgi:hypothetical protein